MAETRTPAEITKRTRDDKINLEDRDGLRAEWGSGLRRWGLMARPWLPRPRRGRGRRRTSRSVSMLCGRYGSGGKLGRRLREWLKPEIRC
jgi:hypothetical protein